MIYVCSDIHGDYEKYTRMFNIINFTDDDTLFILDDIVDRGNDSIKILQDMRYRYNVLPILGNHEYMAKTVLDQCIEEITDESIHKLNEDFIKNIANWYVNGGEKTLNQFKELSNDDRKYILEYLDEFSLYQEITVNNQDYILVHAGISNFDKNKKMHEYDLHELIFERTDYSKTYFKDKILITGHTPVSYIQENHSKNTMFKANNHIAIDGGCGYGGNLIVHCLDNDETFYID